MFCVMELLHEKKKTVVYFLESFLFPQQPQFGLYSKHDLTCKGVFFLNKKHIIKNDNRPSQDTNVYVLHWKPSAALQCKYYLDWSNQ